MKAVVFHKPGDIRVDNVPDPQILDPGDIILRVTSTAICGSDLHIWSDAAPQKEDMIMGHEFMGIVEEVGSAITDVSARIVPENMRDEQVLFLPLEDAARRYQIVDEKKEDCVKVVLKP